MGNTNTVLGTDGTYDNPVSTLAAAKTLADQLAKKLDITGNFTSQAIDLTDYGIRCQKGMALLYADAVTGVTLASAHMENIRLDGDYIYCQQQRRDQPESCYSHRQRQKAFRLLA